MKFVKEPMLMTLSMGTFFLSWGVLESFSNILAELKGFASNQSPMISEIVLICKLLYGNPATAAIAGPSERN